MLPGAPGVFDLGTIGFLREHGRQANTDERPPIVRGVVAWFAEAQGFVTAADAGEDEPDDVLLEFVARVPNEV
jgi:hypothetical protein